MSAPQRPPLQEIDTPAFVAWAATEPVESHIADARQVVELALYEIARLEAVYELTPCNCGASSCISCSQTAKQGSDAMPTAGPSGLVSLDGATDSSPDPDAATAAVSTGTTHTSASAAVLTQRYELTPAGRAELRRIELSHEPARSSGQQADAASDRREASEICDVCGGRFSSVMHAAVCLEDGSE